MHISRVIAKILGFGIDKKQAVFPIIG